jgi:RNA polymerase sigma factor (sigma-70 family)
LRYASDYLTEIFQPLLTARELSEHIDGCAKNSRESQKIIYNSFYGYAMSICDRYAGNYDDAVEILNDGFLKIFKEIYKYNPAYADTIASFKGWIRKIMVYTAIDHYRKIKKHLVNGHTDPATLQVASAQETALEKLSYQEIVKAIQNLSPAYRTVFNLFVMEGLSHDEISNRLGIAEGTSKSNLSKARAHLQKILLKQNEPEITKNAV